MTLDLKDLSPAQTQHFLQHAIAPRPICLASTIDKKGQVNLSPFSFFNLFSLNPPVVIFSPSRRQRNNTTKHSLQNVMEIPEVVINIVDYEMVQQVSLSSCEYPKETNEFLKAGFTAETATLVRPPLVKESKISLECNVTEIKSLGGQGGAGNLVICTVLRIHINDSILNENNQIDQRKLHHAGRLGGDWYCKVDESNLFIVEKPNTQQGIGVDALPAHIRNSDVLTGNNLGQLANVTEIPVINPAYFDTRLNQILQYYSVNPDEMETELHIYARELLQHGNIETAWQVLLAGC